MRRLLIPGATAIALFASFAASAQTRPPLPALVLAQMRALDARCVAAGGRPGSARYVFAQDFTGDGLLDYLVSEGDYACTGRPALFRNEGQATIELLVTDRANVARRHYAERVLAYRIVAGTPVKLQVARSGAACGAGAAPGARCATQLAWNGSGFGDATQAAEAPPPATPAAAGEAAFLARCRADLVRRDASAARWADQECRTRWGHVVAAGPAAARLLAAIPAPSAARPSLAALRQQMSGVTWAPHSSALATGRLGSLEVTIAGRAQPEKIGVNWAKQAAEIPYDIPQAMRERGATVTETACEKTGVGAGTRSYAGVTPAGGRFTLTLEQQTAPLGSMMSYYDAWVTLDGRHPARGSTSGCDF
ncbi:hypothetical protein [Sphingomonas sp.]|uniref:hypothetical protein n=1 Tax=Sphingomonas sp. TaxID=28214 RepID=UPI002DD66412|nr:hypothetical protein [Sphingomonas sp.]